MEKVCKEHPKAKKLSTRTKLLSNKACKILYLIIIS